MNGSAAGRGALRGGMVDSGGAPTADADADAAAGRSGSDSWLPAAPGLLARVKDLWVRRTRRRVDWDAKAAAAAADDGGGGDLLPVRSSDLSSPACSRALGSTAAASLPRVAIATCMKASPWVHTASVFNLTVTGTLCYRFDTLRKYFLSHLGTKSLSCERPAPRRSSGSGSSGTSRGAWS